MSLSCRPNVWNLIFFSTISVDVVKVKFVINILFDPVYVPKRDHLILNTTWIFLIALH